MPRTYNKCIICNIEFLVWPYEKHRKYCSSICSNISKKNAVSVECDFCRKKFKKIPSEIKRTNFNFCTPECRYQFKKGKNHDGYIGGHKTVNGYKVIYINGKKILEHRHVIEQHINRKLKDDEHIHHINEDKLDNRIENLKIVSQKEHGKIHEIRSKKWSRKHRECKICKKTKHKHESKGLCQSCHNKKRYKELKKKKNFDKKTPESPEQP